MEKNGDEYNPQYLDSLNLLYENFVVAYPKDSLAVKYLLSSAKSTYSRGTQEPKYIDIAIPKFARIISNYPESKEVETATYLLGNIYENNINDTNAARTYYNLYLSSYPNGEYAPSIKMILDGNLGKTPEEWLEKFKLEGKIDTSIHVQSTGK